jgi:hypothetical protein
MTHQLMPLAVLITVVTLLPDEGASDPFQQVVPEAERRPARALDAPPACRRGRVWALLSIPQTIGHRDLALGDRLAM